MDSVHRSPQERPRAPPDLSRASTWQAPSASDGQGVSRSGQGPRVGRTGSEYAVRPGRPNFAGGGSAVAINMMRRSVLAGCVLAAVSSCFGLASAAGAVRSVPSAVGPADWPAYLDGPSHTSDNKAQVAITPTNVDALVQKWHFVGDPATMPGQPSPAYNASPTVADGAVFIGSRTGWFYKLDEQTGTVLAKKFIGFQPHLTCTAGGPIATATVAKDPADGKDTVYVGAPDGYLYALRVTDLSVKWRSKIAIPSTTVSDYFQWSSPTVANGKIYIGVSSHCDKPLTAAA